MKAIFDFNFIPFFSFFSEIFPFFFELFQYRFIQYPFLGLLLICALIGILSPFVYFYRLSGLLGSFSHASLGGVGLVFFLNSLFAFSIDPFYGVFVFLMLGLFLFLSIFGFSGKKNQEVFFNLFWAWGMGLGILFMQFIPGYKASLTYYLFGNIFLITSQDLLPLVLVLVLDLVILVPFRNLFLGISFDKEFMQTRKIPVNILYTILLSLIMLNLVFIFKTTGIVLTLAFFSFPMVSSLNFGKNLISLMFLSFAFVLVGSVISFFLSYSFNIVFSGATVLLLLLLYASSWGFKKIGMRFQKPL